MNSRKRNFTLKTKLKDSRRLKFWDYWCKALGEKALSDDKDADKVAIIRTIIVFSYLITNFIIIAGVLRHWND
jgi:hypothetical protein